MTKKLIDDSIALAVRCGWSAVKLGHELTGPPYTLTPPEATIIMDEYRRRHPVRAAATILPATPKLPRRKAKATPSVAAEGGELLTTPTSVSTGRPSIINRSAVKAFALKVSREKRAGKFKRVSKEFLDGVEASLEALIREIAQGYGKHDDAVTPDPECDWFINGRTLRCAEDKLNEAVQKIILTKVHGHPTIGKTLK